MWNLWITAREARGGQFAKGCFGMNSMQTSGCNDASMAGGWLELLLPFLDKDISHVIACRFGPFGVHELNRQKLLVAPGLISQDMTWVAT